MVTEALVSSLRVNEAQMRTRVAVAELARLAVQVSKGLDHNLPLLLRPDGHGGFTVVSGHRRWLALMIAFMAVADLSAEPDLEGMQAVIEDICDVDDGFVILDEGLYEFLQEQMPATLSVPYRLWDGSREDEILLLIKANSGAEEPDLLGQAVAYRAAVDARVSYEQLAQVTGRPAKWLKALVILLTFPAIFGELINDGLLDLSVVVDLTGLPKRQIKALAGALTARVGQDRKRLEEGQSLRPYTNQVQLAILQMAIEPEVPKRTEREPAGVNYAAAVQALWEKAREETPGQFYRALARHSLAGERLRVTARQVELLSEVPVVKECFEVKESAYGAREVLVTDEAIKSLYPDRECAGCAFIDLPAERVREELPLPCRSGPAGTAFRPCWHWAPKGRKFTLRTPWKWHLGGKLVTSLEDLQEEWQKQWDREHQPDTSSNLLSGSADSADAQRENIATYMQEHQGDRLDLTHPWATACAQCAHHLDKSPVKADPDAPHCAWAKGRRRLQFRAFVPCDEEGGGILEGIIPFCLQYAPDQEWAHIVPEADTDPPFERGFLMDSMRELAESVNRNVYSTDDRGALQFLTGRPVKASANHRKTFRQRFDEEAPLLSDRQIWTLFQWLWLEWLRLQWHGDRQWVPFPDGLARMRLCYFGQIMPGGVMEEVWED
jgi:hypothetical protein